MPAPPIFDVTKCPVDPQPSILGTNLVLDCNLPPPPPPIVQPPPPLVPGLPAPIAFMAFTNPDGIDAATGTSDPATTVPGVGRVNVYSVTYDASGGVVGIAPAGVGDALNFAVDPVGGSKWIAALQIGWNVWFVVWELCPPSV